MKIKTHAIGSQGLTASVEGLGTMGMTAMYGTRDDAGSVLAKEPTEWLASQQWTTTDVTTVTEEGRKEARTIPDDFARPGANDVWLFAGARPVH